MELLLARALAWSTEGIGEGEPPLTTLQASAMMDKNNTNTKRGIGSGLHLISPLDGITNRLRQPGPVNKGIIK